MAKILVIDDNARDRELLAAVLEERGYEVILGREWWNRVGVSPSSLACAALTPFPAIPIIRLVSLLDGVDGQPSSSRQCPSH